MRVIAGVYRGRNLLAPSGSGTRPILDRIKVSLFDWLGSMLALPGSLPPIAVLDLFCGGGSLGIEALSRGAAHCTFVEQDREAARCLRENLASLKVPAGAARVCCESAERVRQEPPGLFEGYALVFLDPPYCLSEDFAPGTMLWRIIERLGGSVPVVRDAMMLWRHDAKVVIPEILPGGWCSSQRRVWGSMAVTMLTRSAQVST